MERHLLTLMPQERILTDTLKKEQRAAAQALESYLLGLSEQTSKTGDALPNRMHIARELTGNTAAYIPTYSALTLTEGALRGAFAKAYSTQNALLAADLLETRQVIPPLREEPLIAMNRFETRLRNTGTACQFILKTDAGSNLHEYIVRIYALNRLRQHIPNFSYAFVTFSCTDQTVCSTNHLNWCEKKSTEEEGNSGYYLLEDNYYPTYTLRKFLTVANQRQVILIIIQLINAFRLAYTRFAYTNYGLTLDNLFVSRRPSPVSIPIYNPQATSSEDPAYYIAVHSVLIITGNGQEKIDVSLAGERRFAIAGSDYWNEPPVENDYEDVLFLLNEMFKVYNERVAKDSAVPIVPAVPEVPTAGGTTETPPGETPVPVVPVPVAPAVLTPAAKENILCRDVLSKTIQHALEENTYDRARRMLRFLFTFNTKKDQILLIDNRSIPPPISPSPEAFFSKTPSTSGELKILQRSGITEEQITEFRKTAIFAQEKKSLGISIAECTTALAAYTKVDMNIIAKLNNIVYEMFTFEAVTKESREKSLAKAQEVVNRLLTYYQACGSLMFSINRLRMIIDALIAVRANSVEAINTELTGLGGYVNKLKEQLVKANEIGKKLSVECALFIATIENLEKFANSPERQMQDLAYVLNRLLVVVDRLPSNNYFDKFRSEPRGSLSSQASDYLGSLLAGEATEEERYKQAVASVREQVSTEKEQQIAQSTTENEEDFFN